MSTDTQSVPITTTNTVTLAEIRDAVAYLDAWQPALSALTGAVGELTELLPALDSRIERNRQRSERAREQRHCNGNGNGHRSDYAIKLARNGGVMLVCRKCGRAMA